MKNNVNPQVAFDRLFDQFVDQAIIQYEEDHLEEKYPEFKSLMREYEEGILLFEITKMNVWDKASQDTTGLKKYFYKNRDNYTWDERARILELTVDTDNQKLAKKIQKHARKKSMDKLITKFNKKENIISFRKRIVEKDKLPEGLEYSSKAVSPFRMNEEGNKAQFYKMDALLPVTQKSLKEARGFVIADYQTQLEKEWIEELSAKYSVKRNEKVFNALIK